MDKEEANIEYSRIYSVWCDHFMSISMLHKTLSATIDHLPRALHSEFLQQATATVNRPGMFSEAIERKFPNLCDDERIQQMAKNMAGGMTVRAMQSLGAAVIVLAHSILDAATTDYVKLSMKFAPDDWHEHLKLRKIPFLEFNSTAQAELIIRMLADEMKTVRKLSLIARIELLRLRCLPASNYPFDIPDYVYDPDQVGRLDQERHRILHEVAMHDSLGDPVKDTRTLRLTCLYLSSMLGNKYELSLSKSYFLNATEASQERMNDEWLPTNSD